jgi:hypothetical protein
VRVLDAITSETAKGGKVIIEHADGTRKEFLIV